MVFFICGGCGNSFKRKQADLHTTRCRNWCFSCIDCQKDFPGRSYIEHTKCISESEKYFGDHHVPKVGKDKNEIWMKKLREHLSKQTLDPFQSKLMSKIMSYQNVPRKAPQFKNFLKTNMFIRDEHQMQMIWNLVEGASKIPTTEETKSSCNETKIENAATIKIGIEELSVDKTVKQKFEIYEACEETSALEDAVSKNGDITNLEAENGTEQGHVKEKRKKKMHTESEHISPSAENGSLSEVDNMVKKNEVEVANHIKKLKTKNKKVADVKYKENEMLSERVRKQLVRIKSKPYITRLVTRMLQYPNIPIQFEDFETFLNNHLNISHEPTVTTIWAMVQDAEKTPPIQDDISPTQDDMPPTQDDKKSKTKHSDDDYLAETSDVVKSKKKKKDKKENVDENVEPKKTKKRMSEADETSQTYVRESKSALRKRRKLLEQCATEEPATFVSGNGDGTNQESADFETDIDTIQMKKAFKWRSTLKKLLKYGPEEGTKVKKILNQIEQLHNHPVYGAAEPLPKKTLQKILMKTLSKKPFSMQEDRVKKGKFAKYEKDD